MDAEAVAGWAVRVLTDYVAKPGLSLARDIGREAALLSTDVYATVCRYLKPASKARRTLDLLEEDPDAFGLAFEKVLSREISGQDTFRAELETLMGRFQQAVSQQDAGSVVVSGSGAAALDGAVAAGMQGHAAGRDIFHIVQQFQPPGAADTPAISEQSASRQWQTQVEYLVAAMDAHVRQTQDQLTVTDQAPTAPYKGLFYYEPTDQRIFFGRENETSQLLSCIQGTSKAHRVTVLHGASGSGKTSLIQAGLMPALIRQKSVPLYVLLCLGQQVQSPDRAICKCLLDAGPVDRPQPDFSELSFHQFLRCASSGLNGRTLVIVIDQFEDFFIHLAADVRASFVTELAKCYDDAWLPVKFVFSLRKAFFSDLYELDSAVPAVFHNHFALESLSTEQATQAILEPVARLGIEYQDGLLEALLEDLEGEGIEPPQLQVVCSRLYQERQGNVITLSQYERLGRASGMLAAHLSVVMDNLGHRQLAAKRVLIELITAEGTKRILSREELEKRVSSADLDQVLEHLVDARLLRREELAGVLQYELAHEYLIKEVETWVGDDELRLKRAQELLDRELVNWRIFGTHISPDRLEIIERLSVAEGALQLSAEAEELIQRSRERRALDKQEQLQVIQSARMASLDQLVVGLDYELRSPVTCITSDSQFLHETVTEMRRILEQLPIMLAELSQGQGGEHGEGEPIDDLLLARLADRLGALRRQMTVWFRSEGLWDMLDEIEQVSDELQEAVGRMTAVIDALSSFAQTGQAEMGQFRIHDALDAAVLLLQYLLKDSVYSIKVDCQYTEAPLIIRGSSSHLTQLFTHVVMNSIEAIKSKPDGSNGLVTIKTSPRDSWGEVLISDNGIGIPQEDLERVFEPGFTSKDKTRHKGVGLTIARQIAQQHGGTMAIDSVPLGETVVTIRLPLARAEEDDED